LLLLNLMPPYTSQPLVQTAFKETNAEISPDGKWLAYKSNEACQDQIYVRSFSGSGGKWQISTAGGMQPVWARNGSELFYLDPNGALMSVTVSRGSTWSAAAPTKLFEGPYFFGGATVTNAAGRTYDVSNEGRFIRIKLPAETDQIAPNRSVVIVRNWFDELKRLVPTKQKRRT
jgi:eukaryotic-like serine/threonine-protein kinase